MIWSVYASDIWYEVLKQMIFDMECLNKWYFILIVWTRDIWYEVIEPVIFDMKCIYKWSFTSSDKASDIWYRVLKPAIFDMECLNTWYLTWSVNASKIQLWHFTASNIMFYGTLKRNIDRGQSNCFIIFHCYFIVFCICVVLTGFCFVCVWNASNTNNKNNISIILWKQVTVFFFFVVIWSTDGHTDTIIHHLLFFDFVLQQH